jgi:hypothetical protein
MTTKIVNGAEVTEIEVDPSKTNEQLEREAARRAARPAPSDAHKYTIAKIKSHNGNEGPTLNAVLMRDGKKAAEVLDDGNGGMMYFYWVDGHHDTPEEAKFKAFIESERAKIPADKETEGFNEHEGFDGDIWVWDEVQRIQRVKACKKYTLFQVGGDIGGDLWKQVKGVTPDVRAWIVKKYNGQKIRFMNDEVGA